jgi:hypothetical protein
MLALLITLILLPYGILLGLIFVQALLQIPAWFWNLLFYIVAGIYLLARLGVIS